MNKNAELKDLINATKGRFFTVIFRKVNGEIRVINGKDKYSRLLRGGAKRTNKTVSAVNRNKESWFSTSGSRVIAFKCGEVCKFF